MAHHKFKVGQMVDLSPSRASIPASGPAYKILRLLPQEGGEYFYGIKTITEAFEQIVKESKLVRTRKQTEGGEDGKTLHQIEP